MPVGQILIRHFNILARWFVIHRSRSVIAHELARQFGANVGLAARTKPISYGASVCLAGSHRCELGHKLRAGALDKRIAVTTKGE